MNSLNTSKLNIQTFVEICHQKGIRDVVISPGSRNTPLIIAFNRHKDIDCHVIVDERSAAFFALGIAQQSNSAVAIVCTSGTALLNYAPAVAEAYYQQLPLLVISADRPSEWIDQDDSQTIRQFNVLANIVKASYTLNADDESQNNKWFLARVTNEAFHRMKTDRKGPVHINISIDEPLYKLSDLTPEIPKIIDYPSIQYHLTQNEIESFADEFNKYSRIMILVGMHRPNEKLNETISYLAKFPQVIVLTESIANMQDPAFIEAIDRTITRMDWDHAATYYPELLINFGGPIVSKKIKSRIKQFKPTEQWFIQKGEQLIDTFQSLTRQINMDPEIFFEQLTPFLKEKTSDYSQKWHELDQKADSIYQNYLAKTPWSDLKAFDMILQKVPENSLIHLSNGTTIRYHQLFKHIRNQKAYSNRGTSGIDGSTSTAAGAASKYPGFTTLITGDLSFLYDSNALWNKNISPNLRIIVMNNGGGGIFRFIQGENKIEESADFLEANSAVKIASLAEAYHITHYEAKDENELQKALDKIYQETTTTILEIKTPYQVNDQILREYFKDNGK